MLTERLAQQEAHLASSTLALEEATKLAAHMASCAAERRPDQLAIGRQVRSSSAPPFPYLAFPSMPKSVTLCVSP